jgi:hypothetical protein
MKEIIFKGSSHTMGLGIDLVLSNRYNNDEWLMKNGVILPPTRYEGDWELINKHRWPKIICDTMGVNEYDYRHTPHLNHVTLPEFIIRLTLTSPELLSQHISHIIYEPQNTRLFYDDMQFTPQEMLNIISDSKVPEKDKKFIYDWVDNYENHKDLGLKMVRKAMEIHKDIEFIFFMFYGKDGDLDVLKDYQDIEERIVEFTINGETSTNLHELLQKNKLRVCDTAYCYTHRRDTIMGGMRWEAHPHEDSHAGVEAQQMMADNIMKYIKLGTPTGGTTGTTI